MNNIESTEKHRQAIQKSIDKREKELRKLYKIQRKLVNQSLEPFTKIEVELIDIILNKDIEDKK